MIQCLTDESLEKPASLSRKKGRLETFKKGVYLTPCGGSRLYRCRAAKPYFLHH